MFSGIRALKGLGPGGGGGEGVKGFLGFRIQGFGV